MATPLTREDVTGFCLHTPDGRLLTIHRDVCHNHPDEVHAALGTESESDLQHFLDNVYYDHYFTEAGYTGPDNSGLGLRA